MSVKSKLKALPMPTPRKGPVWKGPEEDGITFSLLSRFITCRERFRLLTVEGLRTADHFNAKIEFGSMWHVCEEALAESNDSDGDSKWEARLLGYVQGLLKRYPMDRDLINHWYEMVKAMFPLYVEHWSQHDDVKDRTPLLQEVAFDVPYRIPCGRTVRLRGKWDSVDLIGKGKAASVWLQENKTKSSIDVPKMTRQLSFDLQTMIYLVALHQTNEDGKKLLSDSPALRKKGNDWNQKIEGIRYNVIRRSAHKSVDSMLKKVKEDRFDGRIGEWFSRWSVEVRPADVMKFRIQCLDPILDQLCNWWDHIAGASSRESPFDCTNPMRDIDVHWRHPFGVYNVLDEGGSSDLDAYLDTGSIVGLERVDDLFPELKK